MISSVIAIQPYTLSKTAVYVEIYSGQVVFNVGISVDVNFLNEKKELIETKQISITGAEYDAWQSDEGFIQSILNKIGLIAN